LRFVAAVGHPALDAHIADIDTSVSSAVSRQAEKLVLDAAADLYPKLVPEFDRWTPTSRQRAIRDHLFDFIRFSQAPPNLSEKKYRWIDSTPFFRSPSGLCETIDQIQVRLLAGEPVAYRFYSNTPALDMDLILDAQELELLESLWPDKKSQFVDLELGHKKSSKTVMPPSTTVSDSSVKAPPRAESSPADRSGAASPEIQPVPPEPMQSKSVKSVKRMRIQKPFGPNETISVLLRLLFDRLKGRHGLKVADAAVRTIQITDAPAGREILPMFDQKAWSLNRSHPMVRAVLAAPIPPEDQKDYLASILYTAVNRKLSGITDQDDVAFQEALVDALAADRVS